MRQVGNFAPAPPAATTKRHPLRAHARPWPPLRAHLQTLASARSSARSPRAPRPGSRRWSPRARRARKRPSPSSAIELGRAARPSRVSGVSPPGRAPLTRSCGTALSKLGAEGVRHMGRSRALEARMLTRPGAATELGQSASRPLHSASSRESRTGSINARQTPSQRKLRAPQRRTSGRPCAALERSETTPSQTTPKPAQTPAQVNLAPRFRRCVPQHNPGCGEVWHPSG